MTQIDLLDEPTSLIKICRDAYLEKRRISSLAQHTTIHGQTIAVRRDHVAAIEHSERRDRPSLGLSWGWVC